MPTIDEMRAALSSNQAQPSIEEMRAALSGSVQKKPKEEQFNVLNEGSDIGALDRAAVKNFGGSTEDQIDFLKKRNPNLEVREWEGEIIAKKPEEKSWKKLDPGGMANLDPREMFKDALDVGTDIGSGALSSIAGAAGAVPGALGGFGVGGIATGAAAAGAASAGLETVKQSIGKALGTRKEFSGGEIATSGLLGGLTTGLLGGGAGKKLIEKAAENPQVVKKILSKIMETIPADLGEATKKELTKNLIEEGQQGVLKGAFKGIISKWSGIPKTVLETASKEVPQKTILDLAERGLNVNPAKKYTNLEFADVLEREGLADVGEFSADTIMNAIQTAKQETGSKIQSALDASGKTGNVPELVAPLRSLFDKYQKEFSITQSPIFQKRSEQVQSLLDQIGPAENVPLGSLFNIKNELADIIDYSKSPLSQLKEGAVSKEIRNALIDSEQGINNLIKKTLPEVGEAQKQYAKHMDLTRYLAPKFKDADTSIKTIQNVETLRNPTLKRVIQQFEEDYKVDIIPLADAAETWKYFGRPAKEPVGSMGGGKVLRGGSLGASAGYLTGLLTGIPGAGAAGVAIGGGLGALSSSPAAMKGLLQAETASGRAIGGVANQLRAQQLQDYVQRLGQQLPMPEYTQSALNKQAAAQSAWNMMKGK